MKYPAKTEDWLYELILCMEMLRDSLAGSITVMQGLKKVLVKEFYNPDQEHLRILV